LDLSYKAVGFELADLKERNDGWSFSGYASTWNNIDLGGDVMVKGAFRESLASRKPKLLWQHNIGEPIGVVSGLKEDERGLFGEFKISRTTRGADAYQLLKDSAIDSMSIGYVPTDVEYLDDGVRKLKSVDLLEISIVSLPMNEEALITAVKAMERLPLSAQVDRVLDDVRYLTARCKSLASLRAEDNRPPGGTVRRVRAELPVELKALAAEVETLLSLTAPTAEPTVTLSPRLEIARRRALLAGVA
jgi:uncharacterized protein